MAKLRLVSVCTAVALATAAVFGAVSYAAADVEPRNNEFVNVSGGAEGPMVSGAPISGALSYTGDQDWYYFYVGTTGIVTVNLTGANDSCTVYKYGAGGLQQKTYAIYQNETKSVALEAGLYYVSVDPYMGDTAAYSLKISGATVSAGAPNGANTHRNTSPMPEKLETGYTGAVGPLEPYLNLAGNKDYEGDDDWYYFFNTHKAPVRIGIYDFFNSGFTPVTIEVVKKTSTGLTNYATIWSNSAFFADNWKDLVLPAGKFYIHVSPVVGPYVFSVQGTNVSKAPFAKLGTPSVAKVAGAKYKAYGTITPMHTAGSKVVKIKAYRYSAKTKKWVYKFTSAATVKAYSASQGKYVAVFKLPSRGKWRFTAFHEDAQHFPVYSGRRVITY